MDPLRTSASSVIRYTRFVVFGKHLLWVLVAGIMALVVWIASDNTGESGSRLVFSNVDKSGNLENLMSKPHYQGVDANNQPYTVLADEAVQVDKDTVKMKALRADMLRAGKGGDTWLALNAKDGLLNTQTKKLKLTGGVNVFYEGGYEFSSDHADVDIQAGSAVGDSPVQGQGPFGTLQAKSFEILDNGRLIRFNGSVRMKLYR